LSASRAVEVSMGREAREERDSGDRGAEVSGFLMGLS